MIKVDDLNLIPQVLTISIFISISKFQSHRARWSMKSLIPALESNDLVGKL